MSIRRFLKEGFLINNQGYYKVDPKVHLELKKSTTPIFKGSFDKLKAPAKKESEVIAAEPRQVKTH